MIPFLIYFQSGFTFPLVALDKSLSNNVQCIEVLYTIMKFSSYTHTHTHKKKKKKKKKKKSLKLV